jgi:hypothetical protein
VFHFSVSPRVGPSGPDGPEMPMDDPLAIPVAQGLSDLL